MSAFMRNIDASEWLKNPELEVVETGKGKVLGSSFTLYADEVAPAAVDDACDQRKPAQGHGQQR